MSDVKPRRTAREAGKGKISADDAAPIMSTPPIVPQPQPAPTVVPAQPAAIAEPAREIVSTAAEPRADSVDDAWTAFTEAQALLARGCEEIAIEVTGMARSGLAAAAEAAVALLGARTFSEAVEINAAMARRSLDAMIEGSARLSEIGAKAASEASRPILSQLGASWSGVALG